MHARLWYTAVNERRGTKLRETGTRPPVNSSRRLSSFPMTVSRYSGIVLSSPYDDIFDIFDNGGISFKVRLKDNFAHIYKNSNKLHNDVDRPVKTYKPIKVWVGDHLYGLTDDIYKVGIFMGNSILLQLTRKKYVYVGSKLYEFTTDKPIIQYYSYMGNSGVPYPIAVSTDTIYLMLEKVSMPISLFEQYGRGEHIGYYPYDIYYFILTKNEKKEYTKPIKLKMIHDS